MMAGLHPILCHAMHRSLTPSLSLIVLAATLFRRLRRFCPDHRADASQAGARQFWPRQGKRPLAHARRAAAMPVAARQLAQERRGTAGASARRSTTKSPSWSALGQSLKEQLAALDRSSQEAVDQYNGRAAARDQRIDALEARMAPFNARVEAVAAERAAFGKRCDNRRYDERDEIAIKNGK